ncbi:MAG: NYN domain-containing protein [Gemmatimonadota bacterium]
MPYHRAPHQGGAVPGVPEGSHAALLIDFDNVTMGMRSDLSKELKNLLASDVIKGKVSVQRAYADWRRYPQYIVPLSEASVDLIFAPAYGSNKKNATDIRMAIDALELVFVRPEIGTFILLTGDSDFSSLVLKLKEYGKYVIGVGIQESTSDILVQNCDEYYSYTSLTGLRKTTEADQRSQDPWVLVSRALQRMVERRDVMRSDRLKQVMQELDSSFDEGSFGFSKFSRFLAEASSRGLVRLRKMDNGQYEVAPPKGGKGRGEGTSEGSGRERSRGRRERNGGRGRSSRERESEADRRPEGDPLQETYDLLTRALKWFAEKGRTEIRDSDLKRKLLELLPTFDETELGFPKFSRFLSQAADDGVVRLGRTPTGNFQVSLPEGAAAVEKGGAAAERGAAGTEPTADGAERSEGGEEGAAGREGGRGRGRSRSRKKAGAGEEAADSRPEGAGASRASEDRTEAPAREAGSTPSVGGGEVMEIRPSELGDTGLRLGPRRGSTRRRGAEAEPVLLEGQVLAPRKEDVGERTAAPAEGGLDAAALGLPTDPPAIIRYMAHRYRGVGEKTAETLVNHFGTDVFRVLRDDPEAVARAVTPKRAEQVLEAWNADFQRRTQRRSGR